jgi:hypothetical protein
MAPKNNKFLQIRSQMGKGHTRIPPSPSLCHPAAGIFDRGKGKRGWMGPVAGTHRDETIGQPLRISKALGEWTRVTDGRDNSCCPLNPV